MGSSTGRQAFGLEVHGLRGLLGIDAVGAGIVGASARVRAASVAVLRSKRVAVCWVTSRARRTVGGDVRVRRKIRARDASSFQCVVE
jgi:hypothetical protein